MMKQNVTIMHDMEFHHFICQCMHPQCTLRFIIDRKGMFGPVLEFHLDVWAPWWKRIAHAFWYVLGRAYVPAYGEVYFTDENTEQFANLLLDYVNERKSNVFDNCD